MNSEGTQPYKYMYPFSPKPRSHSGCHIRLSRVSCAIEQVLVGYPFKYSSVYVCVLAAQSCLTLCNPIDCSLTGSSLHAILQARILEWVAVLFSRGSSGSRDRTVFPSLQADSLPSEPPGNENVYMFIPNSQTVPSSQQQQLQDFFDEMRRTD